jgi:hypothetical protein
MKFNQKSDGTDAGVSVVIGFILITAILMLMLTVYQQNVVPQNERAAEIDHHRETIGQLQDITNSVVSAADGRSSSATFKPGLSYGTRGSVFVNSPDSTGRLNVEQFDNNVLIRNAEGVGQSGVFWDGEGSEAVVGNGGDNGVEYNTGYLSYGPNYYHYQNAPNTKMEYGILYKDYRTVGVDQQIPLTSQPLVSGKRINIIMMDGDLSTTGVSSRNIKVKPISASENSISVQNSGNNNRLRVEVPTNLPQDRWAELLASQACEAGGSTKEASLTDGDLNCDEAGGSGHVAEIQFDNSPSGEERTVEIVFEQGKTYDLKLSKLYVTSDDSSSQEPSTGALYAAWSGTEDITIREGSAVSIEASALDKYNNPIDGTKVVAEAVNIKGSGGSYPGDCYGGYGSGDTYSDSTKCDSGASSGDFYQRGNSLSGNDGRVTFVYQAPQVKNDIRLEFRVCLDSYIQGTEAEGGTNQQQNIDNDDVIDQCGEVKNNREA